MQILNGDCLVLLPTIADNSIDAIVTDPPYCLTSGNAVYDFKHHNGKRRAGGGGFMGKAWDDDIAFRPDVWRECLRVLKPGGHIAVFGGSRTHHRVWVAVEDAGFEIRDTLMWLYGSGFPKSLAVDKAIDKHFGAEREVVGTKLGLPGYSLAESKGSNTFSIGGQGDPVTECSITAPATPQAEQWQGYGTALKPSHEPILLARKPLIGTVAQNVLKHGTGALNIDASRVGTDTVGWGGKGRTDSATTFRDDLVAGFRFADGDPRPVAGRWPPNLLLDGSEEVVECFPHTHHAGNTKPVPAKAGTSMFGIGEHEHNPAYYPGAARFFPALGYTDDERRVMYCPKASRKDRAGSSHPTVKPIRLIEWLCRLICPPGGTILDPFAGSGTTGQAAINLGFDVIMIEREDEYVQDIEKRMIVNT